MIKYWRWERHTASDRILDIGGGMGGTVGASAHLHPSLPHSYKRIYALGLLKLYS